MSYQKVLLACAFIGVFLSFSQMWTSQIQDLATNQFAADSNSNCGGNCPDGKCDKCWCGSSRNVLSSSQIASVCAKKEWDQNCCKCIVNKESGGNLNAVHKNFGVGPSFKYDVGLFQINIFSWKACNGGNAPCSEDANLACAWKVYGWGGWKNWSTAKGCGCA